MRTILASGLAALTAAALFSTSAIARAGDDTPPGWGTAIAARVIGEKCDGTLKVKDFTLLADYIAEQFALSVETSGHGISWWADLRDKLEASYVEKYSDNANCTKDARKEAEELVSDVREFQEEKHGK